MKDGLWHRVLARILIFWLFFFGVFKNKIFNSAMGFWVRILIWVGFFFPLFFKVKNDFNFAIMCPCVDGEGHSGPAHPPPGAGEGQRVVQGLLQPLHHLPQNQDAQ